MGNDITEKAEKDISKELHHEWESSITANLMVDVSAPCMQLLTRNKKELESTSSSEKEESIQKYE